jgi:hypothetical protein
LAARERGRDRRSREAARSLSRVDACNPLLQAHPTWARNKHEGRRISTSLSRSGCPFFPPSCSVSRRPIWAGARGDISLVGPGTPRSRNADSNIHELSYQTKATGKEQYHNNFGCYSFVPRSEVNYPVTTFRKKWLGSWMKEWFYVKNDLNQREDVGGVIQR